jgi:hypothetical protein
MCDGTADGASECESGVEIDAGKLSFFGSYRLERIEAL